MNKSPQLILVTGAADCGKSEWAESLAENTNKPLLYIATAQKNTHDFEWMAKIAKHQQRRSRQWQTWEIPQELPPSIRQVTENSCVLIDSLGTWVANCLEIEEDIWQERTQELIVSLQNNKAHSIILVAEETGWGVVPAYELGRIFRSRLGQLIRRIGVIADNVYLVIAGYAVDISKIGTNIDMISSQT